MQIRELEVRCPPSISPLASTDEAIELISHHEVQHLLVRDGDQWIGVLTDTDLLESVAMLKREERRNIGLAVSLEQVQVADLVEMNVEPLRPELSVMDAARHMVEEQRWVLPVVASGATPGTVSSEDLLYVLAESCVVEQAGGRGALIIQPAIRSAKTIEPTDTLPEACIALSRQRCGMGPVTQASQFVGVISYTQIRCAIESSPDGWQVESVGDHMVRGIQTLRTQDTLVCAAQAMRFESLTMLPVTSRDGELLGTVAAHDLLSLLLSPGFLM